MKQSELKIRGEKNGRDFTSVVNGQAHNKHHQRLPCSKRNTMISHDVKTACYQFAFLLFLLKFDGLLLCCSTAIIGLTSVSHFSFWGASPFCLMQLFRTISLHGKTNVTAPNMGIAMSLATWITHYSGKKCHVNQIKWGFYRPRVTVPVNHVHVTSLHSVKITIKLVLGLISSDCIFRVWTNDMFRPTV